MKTITPVNPTDRAFFKNRYILAFGAYGSTYLMVWGNSLDSALDECIDWIVDNAPGLLCDEAVTEAYNEAIAEGMSEDKAYEHALIDVTTGGNNSHHILSYEWFLISENPTRQEVLQLQDRVAA